MKTNVKVRLRGELVVEMVVDHETGEEPTDLTADERREAIAQAFMSGDVKWDIDNVEVA